MTATIERPSVLDDIDALVPPAFWHCPEYVTTIGPEVCGLNESFGYAPSPEQALLHDGVFGFDANGRLAAFEAYVFASRQNLKTGWLIQKANGKAILLKRPLQVWTAHKESATDQAFAEFVKMVESSAEFSKRVRRMLEGKGSKEIVFTNGCRIVFRPRTGKAGQSMTADDVDLDEYFAVEPKHEGSLVPTLSTRPNPQISGASSAPHETSDLQRAVMRRGRLAALGLTVEPRMLYGEWSIIRRVGTNLDGSPKFGPPSCQHRGCNHRPGSEGCMADDREIIKLANPSAGRSKAPSISWSFLEAERTRVQDDDGLKVYLRERLSFGSEETDESKLTIFGPLSVWNAGETTAVADGVAAIGLAMSADRTWIGLTGASLVEVEDENDPEAEPVTRLLTAPLLHTDDVAAAFTMLKDLQTRHECVIALDENGPAASLLDDLEDDDIAVEPMDLRTIAKASGRVFDRVTAKNRDDEPTPTLLHLQNAELDQHVADASWRWISDNRIIARREGGDVVDTTLVEGLVLAAHQAEQYGATFNIA